MKTKGFWYFIFAMIVILSACSFAASNQATLAHPLTDRPVLDNMEQFQFAVIGDVIGGLAQIIERYTVKFTVPNEMELTYARLIFCLGDLRDAQIDNVSMHDIVDKSFPQLKN